MTEKTGSLWPTGKGAYHDGPFPPTNCKKCGLPYRENDRRWVIWPETEKVNIGYEHICVESKYERGIREALESSLRRAKKRRGTTFTRRKDRRWRR